jgi:transcriptional regulator GlxA family with amidase domain
MTAVFGDLGRDTARAVGRQLVLYHRRAGGQSQYSRLLEPDPKSDRAQSVLTFARQNLQQELTVEQLAGVARLSPRQFSRVFQTKLGKSRRVKILNRPSDITPPLDDSSAEAHPIDRGTAPAPRAADRLPE